jgi:glutamyl-tRNA reductase
LGQEHRGISTLLNRLFKQAITAGKRVRTETSIGTGAVSISSAAVELAHLKLADLANCRVAILGAGKMSRLVVQHLIAKGVSQIAILNRTPERAQQLANQFCDTPLTLHSLTELPTLLTKVDLVFTGTSATEPIIHRAGLEPILHVSQALTLIDIAVPRNVHANVSELTHVRVFNVDDLQAVVAQNQESRRQTALEAEALLEEELMAFDVWWRSLETVPTISSLRDKIETIRAQELEKALSRLGSEFAEKHQEVIEALTRGIVNKILHDPMVQLRAQQDIEARRKAMQSLQMLFNLQPAEESAPPV